MGEMVQLEYVLRGAKLRAKETNRTHLPIMLEIQEGLNKEWQHHPRPKDAVMLWAAATTSFFGFLRVGEIVREHDHCLDLQVRSVANGI